MTTIIISSAIAFVLGAALGFWIATGLMAAQEEERARKDAGL